MIDANDSFTVPETVMVRELGTEAVLLHLETEQYHSVDEVGLAMWRRLSAGMSVGQTAHLTADEYSTPVDVVLSDAVRFCQSLLDRGLLAPV